MEELAFKLHRPYYPRPKHRIKSEVLILEKCKFIFEERPKQEGSLNKNKPMSSASILGLASQRHRTPPPLHTFHQTPFVHRAARLRSKPRPHEQVRGTSEHEDSSPDFPPESPRGTYTNCSQCFCCLLIGIFKMLYVVIPKFLFNREKNSR